MKQHGRIFIVIGLILFILGGTGLLWYHVNYQGACQSGGSPCDPTIVLLSVIASVAVIFGAGIGIYGALEALKSDQHPDALFTIAVLILSVIIFVAIFLGYLK